ncbi:hypothetical protein Nepgr_016734 [Nepenthes gracilis]|uniref:Morc S5 domain-containing protein n=1 Tax=Nepenthes gracilis TaxID=150966 RepID=A0AAD3XRV7_NEPGR|nr:hypothetical protein Nepgr_016734 [Nepenthes gracilis]
MPPAVDKRPIDVVVIDSSDDECGADVEPRITSSNVLPSPQAVSQARNSVSVTSANSDYLMQKLECRSFWKAGAYNIGRTKCVPTAGELEHARVHPKFLHSNATSHKWAFGAIAELLDNAVDEICNGATFVKVDKIVYTKDNSPALVFQDDGGGMDPECLRKCMSLGYSSKNSNTTIGQYGNGFKTSTMRLGADVIVFSRSTHSGRATQSIGLLSYTFLQKTGQDDVIVPMVDFDISNHWAEPMIYSSQDDWSTNLKTIIEWSPFASKEQLMMQFDNIGPHGTKIIIFNLWLNDEGIYELSFDDDDEDIRLRDEADRESSSRLNKRTLELQSHISYRIRYSLRAYASILYLRKLENFQIILRGKTIEQFNIAGDLKHRQVMTYKPQLAVTSEEVLVKTTIGFIKEAPNLGVSGFNVYHKNRLIKPFWKVTADGNSRGRGVVGVLEANFINPAHDKQDFERSFLFIRLEARLKQMVADYWKGHCHLVGNRPPDACNVHPLAGSASNMPKLSQADQYIIGLSDSLASPRNTLSSSEPQVGCGNHQKYSFDVQLNSGVADSCQEKSPENASRSLSIDQICEENLQLFMRCEKDMQKENELKQTISKLEKDLEEMRRKCAQLAVHLENKKKQKIFMQQQVGNSL